MEALVLCNLRTLLDRRHINVQSATDGVRFAGQYYCPVDKVNGQHGSQAFEQRLAVYTVTSLPV